MSNFSDVVGKADILSASNASNDLDRFNNPDSAIYLNNGYLTLPPDIYFSGDFSITFWLKFKSFQEHATIFDFGNGPGSDNILFDFIYTVKNEIALSIRIYRRADDYSIIHLPELQFEINSWYLLAFVLREDASTFYVNDKKVSFGKIHIPNDVNRTMNYIGKSSDSKNQESINIVIEDFKIYKGSLLPSKISEEFNQNCKQSIFSCVKK